MNGSRIEIDRVQLDAPTESLRQFLAFGQIDNAGYDLIEVTDCFFYNLHVSHYVRDWPGAPSFRPPHPAVFEDLFPQLLRALAGKNRSLSLFIKSDDASYFSELNVISTLLAPRRLRYLLCSALPGSWVSPDDVDVGNLVFEWPLSDVEYVVKEWFMSPIVRIEGYISHGCPFEHLAAGYFEPRTASRIREFLNRIDWGFRLWPDNNGMFLMSVKLDAREFEQRLETCNLHAILEQIERRYEKEP